MGVLLLKYDESGAGFGAAYTCVPGSLRIKWEMVMALEPKSIPRSCVPCVAALLGR